MIVSMFQLVSPSVTSRRVMLAVEFVDPIRGSVVGDGLRVKADGLGAPLRPPSGRFVWLDRDPPAARSIKVMAEATQGEFAPFSETFAVPAHFPGVRADKLLFRRPLVATGLLDPPAGLTAAGGQLLEEPSKTPLPAVRISVQLRQPATGPDLNDGTTSTSAYVATTDPRGGFVAVITDLGSIVPERQADGTATLWLRLTRPGGGVRFSHLLPVRIGQFLRLPEPLVWRDLLDDPPV
jgi:hypothetical protein